MRKAIGVGVFAAALLASFGCGGSSSDGLRDQSSEVRLQVGGTTCGGNVLWWISQTANNYPFGENTAFPWSISLDSSTGTQVSLIASNTCVAACPSPPCQVTITATIYWEGNVIATQTATGFPNPGGEPSAAVSATIP